MDGSMDTGVWEIQTPGLEEADFDSNKAIVTVLVGEDKVKFLAPSVALQFWSPFFEAACSDRWQTPDKWTVELPEQEPASFQAFLMWIYTGSLGKLLFHPYPDTVPQAHEHWRVKWLGLAQCWVLGDYIGVSRFCNVVMNRMINVAEECYLKEGTVWCVSEAVIHYVYSNTVDTSPLRRLVVDTCVSRADCDNLEKVVLFDSLTNQEFKSDIFDLAMTKARDGNRIMDVWLQNSCHYHDHNNQETRYNCPTPW